MNYHSFKILEKSFYKKDFSTNLLDGLLENETPQYSSSRIEESFTMRKGKPRKSVMKLSVYGDGTAVFEVKSLRPKTVRRLLDMDYKRRKGEERRSQKHR